MTELKTLKDCCYNLFEENKSLEYGDEPTDGVVRESELRQEAIKWIKGLGKEWQTGFDTGMNEIMMERAIEKWIKHFFNINEEDLKDV